MNKNAGYYKGISQDEMYLLSRAGYDGKKIITLEYAAEVYANRIKAKNSLSRLGKKDRLIRIENGKYFIVPFDAPGGKWAPNEFIAVKYWMGDRKYYIGYYTMYNYWGFTDQLPQVIYVLNTGVSCKRKIGVVRYEAVKIKENRYYGIKEINISGETVYISDKERTLVDYIYKPAASFEEMWKVVAGNLGGIDVKKFISYLAQYPEAAVRKRAGYIMEKAGIKKSLIDKLNRTIRKNGSYIPLNPLNKSRTGKIDKTWRVIING